MRSRWLAAALVALVLAGCSSSGPKAAKAKTSTTTSTTQASTSTSSTVAVSTTVGASTSTSRATTTTTTRTTGTIAAPTTVTATAADNGKTLTLHVGDTLQVVLSGCGGCGYQWEMTGQPSTVVFQYEGESSSSTSTTSTTAGQPPVVGAPVTYTWMFKAVSAHTTAFAAGYYPPSQSGPTQTYQVRLAVTSG